MPISPWDRTDRARRKSRIADHLRCNIDEDNDNDYLRDTFINEQRHLDRIIGDSGIYRVDLRNDESNSFSSDLRTIVTSAVRSRNVARSCEWTIIYRVLAESPTDSVVPTLREKQLRTLTTTVIGPRDALITLRRAASYGGRFVSRNDLEPGRGRRSRDVSH